MVTLTFVFNKNKVQEAGYTEDELLRPMREHAAKYDIVEEKYGVFSKEGEDALCVLSMFVTQVTDQDYHYIDFLDEWMLDIDGEKEDCIKETHKWYKKRGIKVD